MKQRSSNVTQRADAVDDALASALEQLGIQRTRFAALGPEQQRLALEEAVYASVKDLNVGANWVMNAAHFSASSLGDFSYQEIDQHSRLVHALIALICLGESAYIRPLVTYLSFPEPRWSLLIEPVLRALSDEHVQSPLLGLRSPRALRVWRSWAARIPASPKMGLTGRLSQLTAPDLSWEVSFQADLADSLWLVSSHQWAEGHAESFDPEIAKSCAHEFYDALATKRYEYFMKSLNDHLRQADAMSSSSCDTVTACIRDRVSQLGARSELLDAWTAVRRDVSPRTNIFLFNVLKPATAELRFARQLVDEMLVDPTDFEREAILGLFRQKPGLDVAYRLVKACASRDHVSPLTRNILADAAPFVMRIVSTSLRRALTDDTHNLCLLSNEDNQARPGLSRIVGARRRALERDLRLIGGFANSPEALSRRVGILVTDLLQRRDATALNGDEWRVQTRTYLSMWVAVLNEWLGKRWNKFVEKPGRGEIKPL